MTIERKAELFDEMFEWACYHFEDDEDFRFFLEVNGFTEEEIKEIIDDK